jgi:hypothetical protein
MRPVIASLSMACAATQIARNVIARAVVWPEAISTSASGIASLRLRSGQAPRPNAASAPKRGSATRRGTAAIIGSRSGSEAQRKGSEGEGSPLGQTERFRLELSWILRNTPSRWPGGAGKRAGPRLTHGRLASRTTLGKARWQRRPPAPRGRGRTAPAWPGRGSAAGDAPPAAGSGRRLATAVQPGR